MYMYDRIQFKVKKLLVGLERMTVYIMVQMFGVIKCFYAFESLLCSTSGQKLSKNYSVVILWDISTIKKNQSLESHDEIILTGWFAQEIFLNIFVETRFFFRILW